MPCGRSFDCQTWLVCRPEILLQKEIKKSVSSVWKALWVRQLSRIHPFEQHLPLVGPRECPSMMSKVFHNPFHRLIETVDCVFVARQFWNRPRRWEAERLVRGVGDPVRLARPRAPFVIHSCCEKKLVVTGCAECCS